MRLLIRKRRINKFSTFHCSGIETRTGRQGFLKILNRNDWTGPEGPNRRGINSLPSPLEVTSPPATDEVPPLASPPPSISSPPLNGGDGDVTISSFSLRLARWFPLFFFPEFPSSSGDSSRIWRRFRLRLSELFSNNIRRVLRRWRWNTGLFVGLIEGLPAADASKLRFAANSLNLCSLESDMVRDPTADRELAARSFFSPLLFVWNARS